MSRFVHARCPDCGGSFSSFSREIEHFVVVVGDGNCETMTKQAFECSDCGFEERINEADLE